MSSCCKSYGNHGGDQMSVTNHQYTYFPDTELNKLVNYPPINFSGNMGSTEISKSEPSSVMTGGASRKKRCKTLKIKNIGVIYKKDIMNPRRDINVVKKQLMALTHVSFPPLASRRRRSSSHKSKKKRSQKKRSQKKRSSKKRRSRKQRGGSTVGYSAGGINIPASQLNLANPAPITAYAQQ